MQKSTTNLSSKRFFFRSAVFFTAFMLMQLANAQEDGVRLQLYAPGLYEERPPVFRGLELQVPKSSFLTREFGTRSDRLHVYAGQFVTVDDNIYLRSDDETGDNIFTTLGGLILRFERPTIQGSVDAEVRYENYDRHDEDNTEYDIYPSFSVDLTERLELDVTAGFERSTGPLDELGAQIVEDQITSSTYSGEADLEWQMDEQWILSAGYGYSTKEYDESAYSDLERDTHLVEMNTQHVISPKTTVGGTVRYGEISYDEDARNEPDWIEGRAHVAYLPTPKLRLYLNAGYQDRDYGNEGTVVTDDEDFEGIVYSSALSYRYSEKWEWTLSAFRSVAEDTSDNSNYYTYHRQALTANYFPILPLKLRVSVFADQISPTEDPDSDRYGLSVGGSYALYEWLGLGASYTFLTRDGDAEGGDYDQNTGTAGLWVSF